MLNRIKTFFKGKRIVEFGGTYIPQLRTRDGLWFKWPAIYCIQYSSGKEYRLTYSWYDQHTKCAEPTKDAAAINLYNYLESIRLAKLATRKIVHDIEPEAWVKLKDNT